jgi:agmatine/peptidylarginine deiminase
MFRILPVLLLLFVANVTFGQEFLPKGMTEYEKSIWDDYIKNYPEGKDVVPPAQIPRTPAEFEEMQGVIVTWTSYTSNLREIVRHAKQAVKVYIVCSSASTVTSYLAAGGVNTENIEFVVASFNSVWVRDYGPQSVYLQGTNQLALVDWIYNRPRPADDVIPGVMANHMGLPMYQMTVNPNRLTATGGNFMTDGFNRGFSSNLILTENNTLTVAQIDTIKKRYMGIQPYVKMTVLPHDVIHHIDMHMKLLDEETLLVGQYPQGVSDGPTIEANLNNILNNYQTPYGRPYRVIRIPMPADEYGRYPSNGSDYLTYTNATILNNLVLVPIYNLSTDAQALQVYRNAMPGYNVVGINMRNVISALGAIHCITREIAANDPIFISHAPIRDTMEYTPYGYNIYVNPSSASGISNVALYWSADTTQGFTQVRMEATCHDFNGIIPAQPTDGRIFYYISVTNTNNKTISKPLVAPAGLYSFYAYGSNLQFDFTASSTVVESGQEVTFTFENNGVDAQSYNWSFGLDANPLTASTVGPHTVSYSTEGSKTVVLTVNGTMTLTKQNYITVTAPIYHTVTISKVGNGTTNPLSGEYQIVNNQSFDIEAIADTDWEFSKWVINSAENTENPVNITVNENITAVAHFDYIGAVSSVDSRKIRVYPNPASGVVSIEMPQNELVKAITISDISGTRINQLETNNIGGHISLNIADLKAGIYFMVVKTETETTVLRFIKL